MTFERIDVGYERTFVVARFLPPPRRQRYDGVALRDELVRLAESMAYKTLIVDFGDYQLYPADLLGCLAHAKRSLAAPGPIRCVDMPLRLQAACRFLKFSGSIVQLYASLEEAMQTQQTPEPQLVVPASLAAPWTYAA